MISAANSDGDEKGFLNQRAFKYHTVKVSLGDKTETVYLTREEEHRNGNVEPLDKRGWTLQEEYLAARNIRFCKTQIVWQCRGMSWSECSSRLDGRELLHLSGEHSWNMVTKEFSQRILTYDTDKLYACENSISSVLPPHVRCLFWVLICQGGLPDW
jgi:hypothetical protein